MNVQGYLVNLIACQQRERIGVPVTPIRSIGVSETLDGINLTFNFHKDELNLKTHIPIKRELQMLDIHESAMILKRELQSLGCQIEVDDQRIFIHMTSRDSRYLERKQWSTQKGLQSIISIVKRAFEDRDYDFYRTQ